VQARFAYNILYIGLSGMFGGVMSATIFDIFGVQLAWWIYAALAMLNVAVLAQHRPVGAVAVGGGGQLGF